MKARAELAYQYELTKDYAAAEETYADLLDRGASNPEIFTRLIDLNLKLNNPERALKLTERGAGSGDFLFNACSLFLQAGFYKQAEEVLQLLPGSLRQEPKAQYFRALIAFHGRNDPARARELLQTIPSDSSLYKRSLGLQARLALKQDRAEEAREILHRAQKRFPGERDFWLLESEILMSKKAYQQAADVLQQGLEHMEEPTELLFQLGVVAHERGEKEKALELMNRVLDTEPRHASALNFIGYTLVELGRDMDRAYELIKRALELEPGNGYFLDSLAWYYYQSGQPEQAWKTIQKAVAKAADDPIIWEHYGDIATSLDLSEEARKGYSKSLQLEPKTPSAIRTKLNELPSP
jgi:tetratricopeptide (TPR) repeat protein